MPQNPLPGVPAVESPFFDEIFVPERYSAEELRIARDLRENGFAVFDFPDAEIQAKAETIKSSLHDRYPWTQWRGSGADMRLLDAWKTDANVRSIAVNQRVLDLLGMLYGRPAWPFQTLNFPGHRTTFPHRFDSFFIGAGALHVRRVARAGRHRS